MSTPRKTVYDLVNEAKARIANLTVEQLRAELQTGRVLLIDLREAEERAKLGWIPGSVHLPAGMLAFWLDPTSRHYVGNVDLEQRIVLH